jgi:16S rRNA (cytidine1402-2'-O)-methyltransferase
MQISIIPTPIGNLEDITLRAMRLLQEADLIAVEDTRTSSKLLKHHGITTPMTPLHMHNEHQKVKHLLTRVQEEDLHLAVISDAGTPGISDPGFLLVREAAALEIPLQVLPGPTAFVPALVASGLPCDRFTFEGFLPTKKGRMTRLKSLVEETRTMVFYESPHRILKTLGEFVTYFGEDRNAAVSREISKIHETHVRGTLTEIIHEFETGTHKGEMVIVLAGKA